MAIGSLQDNAQGTFVDSLTRPGKTAVEIVGSVDVGMGLSGLATENKQDVGNASLASIDSTVAKDSSLSTINNSVNTLLKPSSTLTAVTTIGTITNPVAVTGTFFQPTQPVSAGSLPLPSGAATSAKQDLLLAELQLKADLTETQPISASSLPLPSGASTSANQTTANTSLSSILAATTNGTQKTKIIDDLGNIVTTLDAGAGARPLMVAQSANNYFFSSSNSTTTQLAAGATFPGMIETIINQQNYSILITCDQPGTLTILQYIDAAGAFLAQTLVFAVAPAGGFARSGVINGNYLKVTFQNTGSSATTTLNINMAYGTILPATQSNNQPVESFPVDSFKASYSASISALVLATSPTDVFTISGSATKTIRITSVEVSGTTTSGSGIKGQALLIRRSTLNSGGTSTSPTKVPYDSASGSATVAVLAYTANPTLGAAVGAVRALALTFLASGTAASLISWFFGNRPTQAIVLRGTTQLLAINLGAISVTGGLISASIEWTEE